MTTTRTKTTDYPRTVITMTDGVPVSINRDEWPLVASAKGDHGASLFVRKHTDGRLLVSGQTPVWRGGRWADARTVAATIRLVATDIDAPEELARKCIADLPAEEV